MYSCNDLVIHGYVKFDTTELQSFVELKGQNDSYAFQGLLVSVVLAYLSIFAGTKRTLFCIETDIWSYSFTVLQVANFTGVFLLEYACIY